MDTNEVNTPKLGDVYMYESSEYTYKLMVTCALETLTGKLQYLLTIVERVKCPSADNGIYVRHPFEVGMPWTTLVEDVNDIFGGTGVESFKKVNP
tara:strand:- start:10 stop:294 length:285 start_codon:yes stop_codon:yes gene_type:complete